MKVLNYVKQIASVFSLFLLTIGCDRLLTETPPEGDDFETPFAEMSYDLNAVFSAGDEAFEKTFTVAEGLGPIFNNNSCEGCHPADGRGTATTGFFRISRGEDLAHASGGPQHQDKSIPGIPIEAIADDMDRSRRMPPPVFGMGLIEAISAETILSHADPDDADNDGISGRANWVLAPDYVPITEIGGGMGDQLGRFGRKASVSSLIQQIAEAYQQDVGITNDFIPEENVHPLVGFANGDLVADPEIPPRP